MILPKIFVFNSDVEAKSQSGRGVTVIGVAVFASVPAVVKLSNGFHPPHSQMSISSVLIL